MVRAILEGRKTVTRRVVKPQPQSKYKYKLGYIIDSTDKNNEGRYAFGTYEYGGQCCYAKPPYKVGDVLYVRETWTDWSCTECDGDCISDNGITCTAPKYLYKADGAEISKGWKPSIHMPKAAARIFLKVTDIRVERLQDMTKEDALKEGINPKLCVNLAHTLTKFKKLWDSTIKPDQLKYYSWEANPYVWVIEFERVDKCSD